MKNGELWWGNNFTNAPSNDYYRVLQFGETQLAFRFIDNNKPPYVYIRTCVNNIWQHWGFLWNDYLFDYDSRIKMVTVNRSTQSDNVWIEIQCTDGKKAYLEAVAS